MNSNLLEDFEKRKNYFGGGGFDINYFELEREILGFGDQLKVFGPRRLVNKIQSVLKNASALYSSKGN